MGPPALKLTGFIHIEHFRVAVHAGRNDNIGSRPFKSRYTIAVTKRTYAAARLGFPYVKPTIAITTGNVFTIGAEANRGNPVSMFLDLMNHFTGFGGENAQETIRATVSDEPLIRADVRGQHSIKVIPNCNNLFALCDIPDGRKSKVSTSATTNNKIFAIG